MRDTGLRVASILMTVAVLGVVFAEAAAPVRVPIVLLFAFLGPGLAAVRFLPADRLIEQLALAVAMSVAIVIGCSLALLPIEQWSGPNSLLVVAAVTAVAALGPARVEAGESSPASRSLKPAEPPIEWDVVYIRRMLESPRDQTRYEGWVLLAQHFTRLGQDQIAREARLAALQPTPPRLHGVERP